MKILLFEYISGGGFNKQELPASLVNEGLLMLQALIDNLLKLNAIEIIVMLDWRVIDWVNTRDMNIFIIKPEHQPHEEFVQLTRQCDAVWPIAPEFDGILQSLCRAVELSGKHLLTSPSTAVAMTANKFNTYQHLMLHTIATVPTQRLVECKNCTGQAGQEWIIKPVDGVGCAGSYLITSLQDSELIGIQPEQYIIQPHIQGLKTSLSCLFKQGQAWLLSANLQKFSVINSQYQLENIIVNHYPELINYQNLADKIAQAFPELWGYAGIDLIETPEQILVLEINPRLTTSFVGIGAALGINVAENVLQLLEGNPTINRIFNNPVTVNIKHNVSIHIRPHLSDDKAIDRLRSVDCLPVNEAVTERITMLTHRCQQNPISLKGEVSDQQGNLMKQTHNIGWDIGGAHVKAVVLDQAGEINAIFLSPCPLWKGIVELQKAVTEIMQKLPVAHYRHAITMTGELVDCFAHREDGVKHIIAAMSELLPADELLIFAGKAGLINAKHVKEPHYQAIASANWLVSATYVAQKIGSGLFIDIGSTTTDILLLNNGEVKAQGYTDYQRLISQELIYTGIIRTAVMAVAQTALDDDNEIGIMAEYFATMADVYRITGELNESHDHTETADGAEKTIIASARRLSRMIGCDFYPDELPRWQKFAENIRAQQLKKIQSGCERHISTGVIANNSPFIGAGVGRFLVKQLALNLGQPYLDFSELCPMASTYAGITPADCAPAMAMACLEYRTKDR